MTDTITLGNITIANDAPLTVLGGLNVLESETLAQEVAGSFQEICRKLDIPFVFKASFDKANRSSINSFRGPGLEKGLAMLESVKQKYSVPLITDIHEPWQAEPAAAVVDILQLPAFLSRQTDLVTALAATGAVINIKKAQFLAPAEMSHILGKFHDAGNDRLMLCERGTSFGYNNLVVDMLGFATLKSFRRPVIFDVTHALQLPGARPDSAGGRRGQLSGLAKAGIAQGIAGLFIETHPQPDQALCDGPCAIRLDQLEELLGQLKELDDLVKRQPALNTE